MPPIQAGLGKILKLLENMLVLSKGKLRQDLERKINLENYVYVLPQRESIDKTLRDLEYVRKLYCNKMFLCEMEGKF